MATKKRTASAEAKSQHFSIKKIKPLTENQEITFEEYENGNHLLSIYTL